jgi:predicted RNase H-like nuclease (RuvC/YqgF family)
MKKLGYEPTSMISQDQAEQIIIAVSEIKDKQVKANLLLGSKEYLQFTELEPEEQKTKTTSKAASKATTSKQEDKIEILQAVIKDLKKQLEDKDKEIKELLNEVTEYRILKTLGE